MAIDTTPIPEGRTHFQIILTAEELSVLSLGMTGVHALIKAGAVVAIQDISMGLLHMVVAAEGEVSGVRDAINSLTAKLDALIEDVRKENSGEG